MVASEAPPAPGAGAAGFDEMQTNAKSLPLKTRRSRPEGVCEAYIDTTEEHIAHNGFDRKNLAGASAAAAVATAVAGAADVWAAAAADTSAAAVAASAAATPQQEQEMWQPQQEQQHAATTP